MRPSGLSTSTPHCHSDVASLQANAERPLTIPVAAAIDPLRDAKPADAKAQAGTYSRPSRAATRNTAAHRQSLGLAPSPGWRSAISHTTRTSSTTPTVGIDLLAIRERRLYPVKQPTPINTASRFLFAPMQTGRLATAALTRSTSVSPTLPLGKVNEQRVSGGWQVLQIVIVQLDLRKSNRSETRYWPAPPAAATKKRSVPELAERYQRLIGDAVKPLAQPNVAHDAREATRRLLVNGCMRPAPNATGAAVTGPVHLMGLGRTRAGAGGLTAPRGAALRRFS